MPENKFRALVRPERGEFLKVYLGENKGQICSYVQVGKKVLGLSSFLHQVGPEIKGKNVQEIFESTKLTWPDDWPGQRPKNLTLEEADWYFSHFFEGREFDLGEIGGEKLNERLLPIWQKACITPPSYTTCHLTAEDLAGIIAYLVMLNQPEPKEGNYYTDDLLDLRNRQALLLHHQLECRLPSLLNKFKRFIERKLEDFAKLSLLEIQFAQTAEKHFRKLFIGQLCSLHNPTNPLAEVSLKREVTCLGPGGIRNKVGNFQRRGIHPSHYSRLCMIETPESESIGYTLHLALSARIDERKRTIEALYKRENGCEEWLEPARESGYSFASKQVDHDKSVVQVRNSKGELSERKSSEVDFTDFYHGQFLGLAANLIPFIQHNDNNRAMMGTKNMKQAVPLLKPELPLIRTGREGLVARLSGRAVYAPCDGQIQEVSAQRIRFFGQESGIKEFQVEPLRGTISKTVTYQKPAVKQGELVKKGQVLIDGAGIKDGELALGANLLVGYMPYYGYNFEDGIVISDRLVREDVLTSLHIWEVEMEVHGQEAMSPKEEKRIGHGKEQGTDIAQGLKEELELILSRKLSPDSLIEKDKANQPKGTLAFSKRLAGLEYVEEVRGGEFLDTAKTRIQQEFKDKDNYKIRAIFSDGDKGVYLTKSPLSPLCQRGEKWRVFVQTLISKVSGFEIAKYRFVLEPQEEIILPQYKGATFRGGFGHAFRRAACTVKGIQCNECLLMSKCVYSYVFETPTPPDSKVLSKNSHVPHPFVIEPPLEDKRIYGKDDKLALTLILIGKAIEYLPYFVYAIEELGRLGIGKGRGKYNLYEVIGIGINEEIRVFTGRERRFLNSGPKVTLDKLAMVKKERFEKVEVEFLSPARLVYEESLTKNIEFHILLRALLRRLSSLMYFHCNKRLDIDFKDIIERAESIRIVENGLVWKDWVRHSSRQDKWRVSGGVVGRISYLGPLAEFLPFLLLGEYMHIGKQTSFGLGKIRVGIN